MHRSTISGLGFLVLMIASLMGNQWFPDSLWHMLVYIGLGGFVFSALMTNMENM